MTRYSVHGDVLIPTFLPSKSFGRVMPEPFFTASARAPRCVMSAMTLSGTPWLMYPTGAAASLTLPAWYCPVPMSRMPVASVVKSQLKSRPTSL